MKQTYKFLVLFIGLAAITAISSTYVVIQAVPSSNAHTENMRGLGHVTLVLYGADGSIKAYRQTDNLIVNNGDNATASKLFGAGIRHTTSAAVGTFNAVQVGTSVTAATTADAALGTPAGHKVIGVTSNATATHGNVVLTTTFNPGRITNSSAAVTEAGIFDNTAANLQLNTTNMFARQVFSSITVGSADTLTITWTVNIT